MITNYDEFVTALKETDYDYELSPEEEQCLSNYIETSFPENRILQLQKMFNSYYDVNLPVNVLKDFLKADVRLAEEVYSGASTDTYVRDCYSVILTEHLGLRQWPCYGDGDEVFNNFIKEYENVLKEKGYA